MTSRSAVPGAGGTGGSGGSGGVDGPGGAAAASGMRDDTAGIGIRLDELLSRREMTLTDLSERVGITVVNLSVLKNGRARAIRFSTLARLCEALDCQPGDLLVYQQARLAAARPPAARAVCRVHDRGHLSMLSSKDVRDHASAARGPGRAGPGWAGLAGGSGACRAVAVAGARVGAGWARARLRLGPGSGV